MTLPKYGDLIHREITLYRTWFNEMVKMHGIQVLYYATKDNKTYTTFGELKSDYEEPELIGCLFEEHPNQKTFRKLGWLSELDDGSSMIHVAYDLPNIQVGALFAVPSGLDDGKARLFRVVRMSNSIVYPASITCEIVPEYENNFKEALNYDEETGKIDLLRKEKDGPVYTKEDVLSEEDLQLGNG